VWRSLPDRLAPPHLRADTPAPSAASADTTQPPPPRLDDPGATGVRPTPAADTPVPGADTHQVRSPAPDAGATTHAPAPPAPPAADAQATPAPDTPVQDADTRQVRPPVVDDPGATRAGAAPTPAPDAPVQGADTRQVRPPVVDDPGATRAGAAPTPAPDAPVQGAETRQVRPPVVDDPGATRASAAPRGDATGPSTPDAEARPGIRDRAGAAAGRALDVKAGIDLYHQHQADGMGAGQAALTSLAQVHTGNVVSQAAGIGYSTGFVGGALLPGGMQNVMPDQLAVNALGTASQFGRAAIESARTGDTAPLSAFYQKILDRDKADPFKGFAQLAELSSQELARAGGSRGLAEANLARDLYDLTFGKDSDLGAAQTEGALRSYAEGLRRGEYSSSFQGITYIGDATVGTAAEFVADPVGTVDRLIKDGQQFGEDLGRMGDQVLSRDSLVFDRYLWGQMAVNTDSAIKRTPIVGAAYAMTGDALSYFQGLFGGSHA